MDKPGLCDVITHRIQTTSEFVPRQVRPYRVPAVFQDEVDRQITELLSTGLIRRSNCFMASSIVGVAKKDGGVRIACDYRYLRTYTVGDAFPMAALNDNLSSDTPRVRAMLLPTGYLEPCEMTQVVMCHVCIITTF